MPNQAYFAQAKKNITILLNEKKFKEAYLKCKGLLNQFPDEEILIDLEEKIENLAREENHNIVEEKIKQQKENWKNKKYHRILSELNPLLELDPKNKNLIAAIQKAQDLYRKEAEESQKEFMRTNRKGLDELLDQNKTDEIITTLLYLEKNNPGSQLVKKLANEYNDKIIEKKINEKKQLLYSDKFDDIKNFIAELQNYDKENPRIKNLQEITKKREAGEQIENAGEYLFKGIQHLDTLVRLKKFDAACKVAEELIELDKDNKQVLKLKKKAENGFYKTTRDASIKLINLNKQALKTAYKESKDEYIKI